MLAVNKLSDIEPYSKKWFDDRLGRMTSSRIYCICSPNGIGEGGMTYIRNKASERITGVSTDKNIITEATDFGIKNEPLSIKHWKIKNNVFRITEDVHIVHDDIFASTPDALAFFDEKLLWTEDEQYLNCCTVESKSYITPSEHMKHIDCETPEDIKKINPQLYWQVISQIYWADVMKGYAIFFNPTFPENNYYHSGQVEFRRVNLKKDFDLFKDRTNEAREIYNNILNKKKCPN